jgi:hypothetical protein
MASLYAANDPCVAHRSAPPASGTLVKLFVEPTLKGCDGLVTVSITGVDAKRGGVVLENGTTAAVNLPAALNLMLGYTTLPWNSIAQGKGDATGDGRVNVSDLFALKKAYGTTAAGSPHGTLTGQYNCACDFTHDGRVNISDLFLMKTNYGSTTVWASCPATPCP